MTIGQPPVFTILGKYCTDGISYASVATPGLTDAYADSGLKGQRLYLPLAQSMTSYSLY